jgi:hypothetical protein
MPPVLLIISPDMLDNYMTFGDAVSFDITYKVCNIANKEEKNISNEAK